MFPKMLFQNVFELAAYPCRIPVREDVGKRRAVCNLCCNMPEYLPFHLRLSRRHEHDQCGLYGTPSVRERMLKMHNAEARSLLPCKTPMEKNHLRRSPRRSDALPPQEFVGKIFRRRILCEEKMRRRIGKLLNGRRRYIFLQVKVREQIADQSAAAMNLCHHCRERQRRGIRRHLRMMYAAAGKDGIDLCPICCRQKYTDNNDRNRKRRKRHRGDHEVR